MARVLFDFRAFFSPTGNWNIWETGGGNFPSGSILSNLIDETGFNTGQSIENTGPGLGKASNGRQVAVDFWPVEARGDGATATAGNVGSVTVHGLDPSKTYTFWYLGSINNIDPDAFDLTATIGGVAKLIKASDENADREQWDGVSPDGSGEVEIQFTGLSGARISALAWEEAVSGPTLGTMSMLGVGR